MSYQGQVTYGTQVLQPIPVIAYQSTGNCPACGIGSLQSEMTCLGVFCCIIFFPLGLICLFLLQDQRCSHCGYAI
ncbi:unnamed protein product [Adineta ricciae]|uniref:Membrane protein BRI3 n=1 Tax=Adineta ricciae TaxID=249248 RepID=A0A813XDC6_ADIRI|nr:unnamed protein product [Adineta ricciae]